ncbi:MAG: tyrosine-type recombinase/integrase [Alteromonadaceae bacterium]|nr:tyrosine-type recombinase/integrase [Alteromonadaceae bacterium]
MKKIKKIQDGIWKTDSETLPYQLDFRPSGYNGKRFKKRFQTLGEARRFINFKITEQTNLKDWEPDPEDNRRLSDLIDLWNNLHGKSLNDIKKRLPKMKAVCEGMNNPLARKLTPTDWTKYRAKRLETVSIKTVNNDQTYINAMFNELIRLNEIDINPIRNVRALKYKQPEMGYLEPEEIPELLNELLNSRNKDAYIVAKIALSTGARWGEAESLTSRQISNNRITYINTKGGKNRSVPISEELAAEIPKKKGLLFSSCIGAFKKAIARTEIQPPKGQMTHILRHTFASHFMMNGGNILVLKETLGHASINDTMKYAHFSKTHLEDVVKFNPLAGCDDNNE